MHSNISNKQNNVDYIIYADGSSLGNPGPGGWGVRIIKNNFNKNEIQKILELGGGEANTTNNKMELQALIETLKFLTNIPPLTPPKLEVEHNSKPIFVELRLDSEYVIKGATIWAKNWEKNGWKKADKKPVLNQEYWMQILSLLKELESKKINLKWTHVLGHTGEDGNERVDKIAKGFASNNPVSLIREFKN